MDLALRSVAFLWVSGEEKGLLGSQWFSDHISLPEGYKIVADINLDMVSRNDGKSIGITPSDKHADYSTLIPAAAPPPRKRVSQPNLTPMRSTSARTVTISPAKASR